MRKLLEMLPWPLLAAAPSKLAPNPSPFWLQPHQSWPLTPPRFLLSPPAPLPAPTLTPLLPRGKCLPVHQSRSVAHQTSNHACWQSRLPQDACAGIHVNVFAAGQGHHCLAKEAQSHVRRTDSQADCAKNPGVQLPNPTIRCGHNGR